MPDLPGWHHLHTIHSSSFCISLDCSILRYISRENNTSSEARFSRDLTPEPLHPTAEFQLRKFNFQSFEKHPRNGKRKRYQEEQTRCCWCQACCSRCWWEGSRWGQVWQEEVSHFLHSLQMFGCEHCCVKPNMLMHALFSGNYCENKGNSQETCIAHPTNVKCYEHNQGSRQYLITYTH